MPVKSKKTKACLTQFRRKMPRFGDIKSKNKRIDDSSGVYFFRSHLSAIVPFTRRCSGGRNKSTNITIIARRIPTLQKTFDLLQTIGV